MCGSLCEVCGVCGSLCVVYLVLQVLRHLDLKQVGRHYYDPSNPIAIPQHK